MKTGPTVKCSTCVLYKVELSSRSSRAVRSSATTVVASKRQGQVSTMLPDVMDGSNAMFGWHLVVQLHGLKSVEQPE